MASTNASITTNMSNNAPSFPTPPGSNAAVPPPEPFVLSWLREWAEAYASGLAIEHREQRLRDNVPPDQLEQFIKWSCGSAKLSKWERTVGLVDAWMGMNEDDQAKLCNMVGLRRKMGTWP